MRLNLKDLHKFDTPENSSSNNLVYHGGIVYLYRARFGRGRPTAWSSRRISTMWIASWMPLWPKDSYEVLAMAEVKR